MKPECGEAVEKPSAEIPTRNLCRVGVPSYVEADNSGNKPYWTWACLNDDAELYTECSVEKIGFDVPGLINGECGSANTGTYANAPTSGLCNFGSITTPFEKSGYWFWTCRGVNGGKDTTCYAKKTASPVNGQCGSAHGGSYVNTPNSELCNAGSASSPYASGSYWRWTCADSNGGSPASCSAKKTASFVTGQCGSANGGLYVNAPTSGLCNAGSASVLYDSGSHWRWSCIGTNASSASCYANKIAGSKTNGQCGHAHGKSFTAIPKDSLCIVGTSTTVLGKGPWTWTCKGANGGVDAQCRSELVAPGCGTAHNTITSSAPVKDLCVGQTQGIFVKNDQDGNWTWNCGQKACKAIDPNREYKKKFKALEMAEYTGNPSDPDTAKIAIQNYHCNWLPMGLGAYSKVSCKYEPVGSHGGGNCPECSVVLFEVKKK